MTLGEELSARGFRHFVPALFDEQVRLMQSVTTFAGKTTLEIGAMDGRHSEAAQALGACHSLAIEGRMSNIAHAMENRRRDIQFYPADVERLPDVLPAFDIVMAYGILYHVVKPVALLRRLCALTIETLFISTHCADEVVFLPEGFGGRWNDENNLPTSSLGGKTSFWLTQPELLRCLADCGMEVVQVHPYTITEQPAVWIAARKVSNGSA